MLQRLNKLSECRRPCTWHCQQNRIRSALGDHRSQRLKIPQYLHTMDSLTTFGRIIVHEPNRFVLIERIALYISDDHLASISCAVNQDPLLPVNMTQFTIDTPSQPNPAQ